MARADERSDATAVGGKVAGALRGGSVDPTNACVVGWREVSEGLAVFRVACDEGRVPVFVPGQYAVLGVPRYAEPVSGEDLEKFAPGDPRWSHLIRREVSIASSADEGRWYEFTAVLIDDGKLTPRLWAAGEGGRVWLDDVVRGDFTLERMEAGRDLVLVASGTGVAPFVSMVKSYAGKGERGGRPWRRCVLLHGVRRAEDLAYLDELREIEGDDGAGFRYVPIVSQGGEDDGWKGLRGRVQGVLDGGVFEGVAGFGLEPAECEVYLCGNPGMIDDVEVLLEGRGFKRHTRKDTGNLHFERFW